MTRLRVVRAGALSTVQDLGRAGWAHLGVPRSGALDPGALRLANRLVGNPESAAGLEITLTGCDLRPTRATTAAVVGAEADVWVGDRPGDTGRPLAVPGGAMLRIGPARRGLRCWLAVAGGIAVDPVLGSRSTDTLSGLGPAPLRDGDLLPLGAPTAPPAPVDVTVAGRAPGATGPRRPARPPTRLVHPGRARPAVRHGVPGESGEQPGRRATDRCTAAPRGGRGTAQ